jgi:predicted PhzF superfamily epimerase YddE/YHI9
MTTPIWWIDAFTDRAFSGNPAAVCLLSAGREDAWRQALAVELGLSETAFLEPEADGFRLRWFTTVLEVDLCGHATLAAAHYLWQSGRLPLTQPARFHTRSGLLSAEADGGWIALDFPATPPVAAVMPDGLDDILGVPVSWFGRTPFDLFAVTEDPARLRTSSPDFARVGMLPVRGVVVTAPGDRPGVDFISRFYGPQSGVAEDPVTGSAHCALGPYWAGRLGRTDLTGFQASARGGIVRVEPRGDRVRLAGQAVTVLMGTLAL